MTIGKTIKKKTGNVGELEIRSNEKGLCLIGKCQTGFLFSDIAEGELNLSWEEIESLLKEYKGSKQ